MQQAGFQSRVVYEAVPQVSSLLAEHSGRIDYVDAWATPILADDAADAASWYAAVLKSTPRWVVRLMDIRNRLVKIVGLKAAPTTSILDEGFPLIATTKDETVSGLDDKHLDFRLSLRCEDGEAVITTTVTLHNRLGQAYWAVIRPFHGRVVAGLLRHTGPVSLTSR